MKRLNKSWRLGLISGLLIGILVLTPFTLLQGAQGFTPTKPVEFVIMAGTGGGADIYARFIAGLIKKNNLAPVEVVPVNRAGGGGAVAMDFLLSKRGDPHFIMITLASFMMTPIEQNLAFNWSSFTPIALLALDNFFLWVNSEDSIKNVQDFLKAAKDESMTVGGTGSKQEDELVFSFLQQKAGLKAFKYVPFSGGGAVATALAGKQVRGTVNNPSEGIPFLATPTTPAKLTPIATFTEKPVDDSRFKNLPTVKSLGIDVSYQMLRAIFAPPGISKEAQEYYVGLMEKVFKLEEFRKFLDDNVLDPTFLKGDAFAKFIEDQDALHRDIMVKAGFTKASEPTKLGPNVTIAALAEKKKVTVTNDGPDKVTVVLVDAAGSEVAGEVAAKATGSVTVSGDKTAVKLKIKAGPNGAAVTWKFE